MTCTVSLKISGSTNVYFMTYRSPLLTICFTPLASFQFHKRDGQTCTVQTLAHGLHGRLLYWILSCLLLCYLHLCQKGTLMESLCILYIIENRCYKLSDLPLLPMFVSPISARPLSLVYYCIPESQINIYLIARNTSLNLS